MRAVNPLCCFYVCILLHTIHIGEKFLKFCRFSKKNKKLVASNLCKKKKENYEK